MLGQKPCAYRRLALAALAVLGIFAFQAWAKPITKDEAATAVRGWLQKPGRGLTARLGDTVKETRLFTDAAGRPSFYVVYLKPSGFVIVPADDLVEPIIAFGPGAKFVNSDSDPLGSLVRRDLANRFAAARAKPQTPQRISAQAKWAHLKSAGAVTRGGPVGGLSSVTDLRVAPFTKTTWSEETVQDLSPGISCYNYYTPPGPNGSQDNYPCGCVATAMAQLMYYWQYPTAGVGAGSFTIQVNNQNQSAHLIGGNLAGGPYQWSQMPASPPTTITLAQQEAIGALCYDAGVAVSMDYEEDGSGSFLIYAANALKSTFMYSNVIPAADDTVSSSNIGSGLIGMINPNLDAGFPVILGITGPSGGHAVVADGYGYDAGTLYHHLNMGWSGIDDAYYNLPEIRADEEDIFNVVEDCLYNIYVTGSGEIISGRVVDTSGNAIAGASVSVVGTNGTSYSAATTTNAEGIYAFAKVPSAGSFTLTASASGHYFAALPERTGTSTPDVATSGNVWGANFTDLGAPPTGNLQVTLQPAGAVSAGAEWEVDNTSGWQISGAIVTGLTPGSNHTIYFNTVSGWNSPSSQPATITYNTTTAATGAYVQQTGQVQVTLTPAAAQWNVDGGAWQDSATTLSGVTVGSHTVNFSTVYGWNTPASVPITVAYNDLTSLTESYTVQTGSLTITLSPSAAVLAGAQWRVDGGAWQNNGATVTGLDVAAHTVDYQYVIAWAPPPSETVNILNNTTTSLTRSYVVDLAPPSVSGLDPVAGAWNAPCDTPIVLHVTDSGAGVNATLITVQASRDNSTWETIYSGASATSGSGGSLVYSASSNTIFPGTGYCVGAPADYLILFQPASPLDYEETVYLSVTATDLAGNTINPAYTCSFTTETRSFGIPVQVDTGMASSNSAAAATDANGNVWVTWCGVNQSTSASSIWLAERSSDGCTFGPEIQVASSATAPSIAITQTGTIYLAWTTEQNGSATLNRVNVASATTTAPTSWSSPVTVTNGTLSLESASAMTVDSQNNLYVAGLLLDTNSAWQVAVAEQPSGASSWTVTQITSDAGSKNAPAIAMDATNVVYLVWENSATGNLYGADSSTSWGTIHTVTNAGNANFLSLPAIAAEQSGATPVLHFAWATTGGAPNPNILHAQTTGGWPAAPLTVASVLDGTAGINDASNPKIAVTGTTTSSANAKVFVLWQDSRSTSPAVTDIMFAETNWAGVFGTNVLVSNIAGQPATASMFSPAIGLTSDGAPYAVWTDDLMQEGSGTRTGTGTGTGTGVRGDATGHIYFAAAMQPVAFGSAWQGVTSAGGAQSFTDSTNPHFTEVDLTVAANALSTPRNISVSEMCSPVALCPGGTGLYSDGSGVYLDITGGDDEPLNGWVTVTIHLASGVTLPTPLTVYRLVPPASALGSWTWTTALISNVSYNSTTNTLTFQTMHLSTFGAGTAAPAGSGGGSGGGGGGCSMSPAGEPDLFILLLPFAALALWVAPRLRRSKPAR